MSEKIPKRNLKLRGCLDAWTQAASTTTLKTDGLQPIVDAYHRNLKRVHALTLFPPVIVQVTVALTRIATKMREQFREQLTAGTMTEEALKALIIEEVKKRDSRRARRLAKATADVDPLLESERQLAIATLDTIFRIEDLTSGADAWMSAQISGIWTAFESMAEELWRVALNLHPIGLAELKRGKKTVSIEDKKIDLSFLHRNKYDLSNKMGDVFIASKRYSFDRLDDMRKAYQEAFFCDNAAVKDAIEDPSLDAISETRHVIIHNGGIIDEKFLRRKADLPSAILADAGEPLPLDGSIVQDLIVPVIAKGWALIEAVDAWLDTH